MLIDDVTSHAPAGAGKSQVKIFLFSVFCFLFSVSFAHAQDLKLKDLNGNQVNIADYKGKQPVMLFFWTTWCPYCRAELEKLNLDYLQIKKNKIALLSIDIGESSWRVNRFVKDRDLLFTVLLDEDGLLAEKYEVMGVPTFIFLDKNGEIIQKSNSLPKDYFKLFSR